MNDLKLRPYAAGTLYHHEALDGTGYPHGVKGSKIPYEAQIIRVADEFEAITAKRQYKSHIGIIDALNIIIEHVRPTPIQGASDLKKRFVNANIGKVDKNVVKQLFKVVIDDTEYEIVARTDYVEFLDKEIKRVSVAKKYYDKMVAAKKDDKKDYFREMAKYYLNTNEDPEKIPLMLEEFKEAKKQRQEHIARLYDEVKQIKKLKI